MSSWALVFWLRLRRARFIGVHPCSSVVSILCNPGWRSKAEREQHASPNLHKLRRTQGSNQRSYLAFRDGLDVVQIDRTVSWHAIPAAQQDLGGNVTNGRSDGRH